MAEAVYVLCGVTSVACAVLLLRSWRKSRVRLLLWSGLCFVALALNNVLLSVDLVMVPGSDLGLWRSATALMGIVLLLFGLVWESK